MFVPGLFLRDRIAQPVADMIVRHTSIGPFHVATVMLRVGMVANAAGATTRILTNHEPGGWLMPAFGGAAALALGLFWAPETERWSKRPPRGGLPTATRFHGELLFLSMMPLFLVADFTSVAGSADLIGLLIGVGATLIDFGYILGAALWRDLPRTERRSANLVYNPT